VASMLSACGPETRTSDRVTRAPRSRRCGLPLPEGAQLILCFLGARLSGPRDPQSGTAPASAPRTRSPCRLCGGKWLHPKDKWRAVVKGSTNWGPCWALRTGSTATSWPALHGKRGAFATNLVAGSVENCGFAGEQSHGPPAEDGFRESGDALAGSGDGRNFSLEFLI
jgi:hypothetical protein